MSFAITSDGAPVIPFQENTFITADNEQAQWDVAGYQDSGAWQVTGYNTDSFDHTVYIDFLTVAPGQDVTTNNTVSQSPPPVSDASLSSQPDDVSTFIAGIQVQS